MNLQSVKSAILREHAEELLCKTRDDVRTMQTHDVQELVYELQVHKIELVMQNEALRQAQEKLESSRQKYRDLYDQAPVGYFTLDRSGTILEANLMAARLLGCSHAELMGKKLSRFVNPGSQDAYYMHLRSALYRGVPQSVEIVLINKNMRVRLNSLTVGQGTCRLSMSHII
jgi:PAS domain S-box-containing protein